MNTYTIYFGAAPVTCVANTTVAYACFEAVKTIAEMVERTASLVWDETGEEVASFGPEKSETAFSCATCNWFWQDEGDDQPCCHYPQDGTPAPCEYEDYEPADIDDDCGYDPYAGCFTDDC